MAKVPATRLREPEARLLALAIAASMPGHRASTTTIKDQIPAQRMLTAEDLKPSPTRKGEENKLSAMWSHTKAHPRAFSSVGLPVEPMTALR